MPPSVVPAFAVRFALPPGFRSFVATPWAAALRSRLAPHSCQRASCQRAAVPHFQAQAQKGAIAFSAVLLSPTRAAALTP